MLELLNVSKSINLSFHKKKSILNDVSLAFSSTGLVFIVGEQGNGKTSLLTIAGILEKPSSGKIFFNSIDVSSLKKSDLANLRNDNFGYLLQTPDILESLSVKDNLSLCLSTSDSEELNSLSINSLDKVGIKNANQILDKKARELTSEEKQKISLARCLIKETKVILINETFFNSLNEEEKDHIFAILKEISHERLVLVALSDCGSLKKYADRIIMLNSGKVESDSAPLPLSAEHKEYSKGKKRLLSSKQTVHFIFDFLSMNKILNVFSLIFLAVSIACFGLAVTGGISDKSRGEFKLLSDNNLKSAVITSDSTSRIYPYSENKNNTYLTDNQVTSLINYIGSNNVIAYFRNAKHENENGEFFFNSSKNISLSSQNENTSISNSLYEVLLNQPISSFIEVFESKNYLEMEPDSRLASTTTCNLPKTFDEIAITGLKADMYLKHGYIDDDGKTWFFEKIDDLIGKKLDRFTITGIYNFPGEPIDFIKSYVELPENINDHNLTYLMQQGYYLNNCAIVASRSLHHFLYGDKMGLIEEKYEGIAINISNNMSKNIKLMSSLSYKYSEQIRQNSTIIYHIKGKIFSPFTGVTDAANNYKASWRFPLMYVITAVSGLLFLILQTIRMRRLISKKEKDMAVMSSYGISKWNLAKIAFTGNYLTGGIATILSVITILIMCAYFNSVMFSQAMFFGLGPIVLTILFALIVITLPLISLFIRLMRKTPAQLLNPR